MWLGRGNRSLGVRIGLGRGVLKYRLGGYIISIFGFVSLILGGLGGRYGGGGVLGEMM